MIGLTAREVLLLRIAVLVGTAVLVGRIVSDLLDFRASAGDSAWRFEVAGWLELARCFDGLVLIVVFVAMLAVVAGQRLRLHSRPKMDDGDASDATKVLQARTLEQLVAEEAAARFWQGAWHSFKWAMFVWLCVVVPALATTVAVLYFLWFLYTKVLRPAQASRRRAVWHAIARRPQLEPAVSAGKPPLESAPSELRNEELAWLEKQLLLLFLMPICLLLGSLKFTCAGLRRVIGVERKLERWFLTGLVLPVRWILGALNLVTRSRGLVVTLAADALVAIRTWVLALLVALSIGFATAQASTYSQTCPTIARLLLWRVDLSDRSRIATQAIEKAVAIGTYESVRAIYLAGAVDGIFHLDGYQEERRRAGNCRRTLPDAPKGIQVVLDEKLDQTMFVREARCANSPDNLPFVLIMEAFKSSGESRIDAQLAIESGNPDLLSFSLLTGAAREEPDWQGRTPLLVVLDHLAQGEQRLYQMASVGGPKQSAIASEVKRYAQMAELLLTVGANPAVLDRGRRSAAFLGLQSSLPLGTLEPLLAAVPASRTTVLDATLLHAAAASGRIELIQMLVARGLPIQAKTTDNRTAMHFARGEQMVWSLLELGLEVDSPDARGRTPFHHAVIRFDAHTAAVLGRLSSNRNALDYQGRTAFDYVPLLPKNAKDSTDKGGERPAPLGLQPWQALVDELSLTGRRSSVFGDPR